MAKRFPLNEAEAHFKRVLQYAPGMLGNDAVNFFLDSFKRQGWLGNTFEPWRQRSAKNKKIRGRAILVQSGYLRRSIRITSNTGGIVTIGSDAPYAKAHNEGFKGTVNVQPHTRKLFAKHKAGTGKFTKTGKERMRTFTSVSGQTDVVGHTRRVNIVKRQFMGNSPYLENILQRRLQAELMKGLR